MITRSYIFKCCLIAIFICVPAQAIAKNYLQSYIENPKMVGQGRLHLFFSDLYEARLYAENGVYDKKAPFALQLKYLRAISKEKIIDRILDEMSAQGIDDDEVLERWRNDMLEIFPDIKKGSTLSGLYTPQQSVVFFKDGKLIGESADQDFARAYFNIWLREDASDPELRRALLSISE